MMILMTLLFTVQPSYGQNVSWCVSQLIKAEARIAKAQDQLKKADQQNDEVEKQLEVLNTWLKEETDLGPLDSKSLYAYEDSRFDIVIRMATASSELSKRNDHHRAVKQFAIKSLRRCKDKLVQISKKNATSLLTDIQNEMGPVPYDLADITRLQKSIQGFQNKQSAALTGLSLRESAAATK